jgi:outer membrane protein OmpA-like peptidoglycan-associated protein
MSRALRGVLVALIAIAMISFASGQTDSPGSKDYPGLSRLPGSYIDTYKEAQFDSFTFTITEAGKDKKQPVEGHLYFFSYRRVNGASPTSALQVVRNYQNAVRAAGGQVLRETGDGGDRGTTLRLMKNGSEVWFDVHTVANGGVTNLNIVEKQAMQQEITINAAALAGDITTTGHSAVYGIYFDTAKAEVKPESEAALTEIAKLLQQTPALKLFVVGHTDSVGAFAANMDLSKRRAQAVVVALTTKYGVAPARLVAQGCGSLAPVASNDSEDGRAKNRRVDLVKQ